MELSAPLNVHWEITNECNFNCLQCYQRSDNNRCHLTDNQILYVASQIVEAGIFQVSLSGGEPFMVPVLFDVIRLFKKNNIDVIVCSNGSLISDTHAALLRELDVPIQISLDSSNEQLNNQIRGHQQAFNLALNAIDILVRHSVDVSISFCATKNNFMDLGGVAKTCISHNVKKLIIGEMLPVRSDVQNKNLLSRKEYIAFLENARKIKDELESLEIFINTNWGFIIDSYFDHAPCTALDRDFAILYNGYVTPCPFIRHMKYYLGNILDESIKEI